MKVSERWFGPLPDMVFLFRVVLILQCAIECKEIQNAMELEAKTKKDLSDGIIDN